DAVLVPLLPLQLDVAVEDVWAERLLRELRPGKLVDRLAQRLGEGDDASLAPLLGGQVVQVRLHRIRELIALLDPLEPGVEEAREREVRVARGIRAAKLRSRRLLRPRLVQRDADQRRPIPLRPRDVDGSLVAGDEPLVRVDPLREYRGDLARVAKLAGDELLADLGEVPRVVRVEELVAALGEEGLMRVHAGPVL